MEDPSNIGFRCPKQRPDLAVFQETQKVVSWQILQTVVPMPKNPRKVNETMWIVITSFAESKQEELRGTLQNDPVFDICNCGDKVEFSRNEILEVLAEP